LDHRDPRSSRIAGRSQIDELSIDTDFSLELLNKSGSDLHQGRFAGTILTHERVNLSRPQLEIDLAKHFSRAKRFRNLSQLQSQTLGRPADEIRRGHMSKGNHS
jgi:hypothetical protein